MNEVFIIGAGMIKFSRYPDRAMEDFTAEAIRAAIADAEIDPRRLNLAVFGHTYQGTVAGQRILREMGMTGMPVINVENACAGGGTAVQVPWSMIRAGVYDVALVVGMEKMERGLIAPAPGDYEGVLGRTLPSRYALRAKRHMEKYGTTAAQMAMVSVKAHKAGAINPYAHYRKELSLAEVLDSRPIADPLTLLQCCPATDGAAALVIASGDVARQIGKKPVKILASGAASGAYRNPLKGELASDDDINVRAGQAAYEMAGLGPEDIDVAEVHDAFTIGEIMAIENLGLCPRGEGGRVTEEGVTSLGGRLPVNPSGGRLSLGHPLGATGVAQMVELTWHLQGRAGARQVPGAKVALAHVVGGPLPGIGSGACTVHILAA